MDLPPGSDSPPMKSSITHNLTQRFLEYPFSATAIAEIGRYPTRDRDQAEATGAGYWKATGRIRRFSRPKPCWDEETLVFYKGRAPEVKIAGQNSKMMPPLMAFTTSHGALASPNSVGSKAPKRASPPEPFPIIRSNCRTLDVAFRDDDDARSFNSERF
nr:NAC domain-containing protein 92-like [Ipomoea batatas]